MAIDDSISARITSSCPQTTAEILKAAWNHDVAQVSKLLDEPGKASLQDPLTGETPLHAAVRSCGPAGSSSSPEDESALEQAKATVSELLLWGGIWNDVDNHNETPGCLAHRLGQIALYNLFVEAGVRAEMLFGVLDGYEALSSGSEADDEDMAEADEPAHVGVDIGGMTAELEDGADAPDLVAANQLAADFVAMDEEMEVQEQPQEVQEASFVPPSSGADGEVKSERYLQSKLTYSDGKLVDDDGNGVMMAWETDIMRRSVDVLVPENAPGKRILNIGFGMGIIDSMFAETKPARHHVIEAHEEVLAHLEEPDSKFGTKWEASGPEEGAYKIHQGRWQDVVPTLLEKGEVYDAVYFDTFGEDYSQLKMFFTEYIPGLLESDGVFGFFNGLGADRPICYDVYTRVVEMHLSDAGMDVEWKEIDVDLKGLEEAGKGEWEGVKRRYWTLDKYRLPVCTFLG
ncbi:arginine N-methyltransferase 2 [Coniella lustricola]|uniref:Arginine N-methyltransferase 2 n=1 Tax=Coniella lustricola TaxID=2025994 RepID=A0A2T3A4J5_9PEZI|nr:arginine N-methyltransferase 2 [Coniella lustricola]